MVIILFCWLGQLPLPDFLPAHLLGQGLELSPNFLHVDQHALGVLVPFTAHHLYKPQLAKIFLEW